MVEEEVLIEVDAVQAVYGDDCLVLSEFSPHLHVHIKPRTADITSEQFVEAVLGIQAGPKYPVEAPHISIIESKGLDEERQKQLLTCIEERACELSSSLMLVALFEEAIEKLSVMNHPDGNCPLCLYPLVPDVSQDNILPYMKLMSCFHCFHSACLARWLNWLQAELDANCRNSITATVHTSGERINFPDMPRLMKESGANCPVCRKVFHAKDIEHVLGLVGPQSSQLSPLQTVSEVVDDKKLLESDVEILRRQKFEAILRLQQENSGLIEPKRNEVLRPGMFLPQPTIPPVTTLREESSEQPLKDLTIASETNSHGSSNTASTSEHRKSHTRKHRLQNSRKPRQWIKKETSTAG